MIGEDVVLEAIKTAIANIERADLDRYRFEDFTKTVEVFDPGDWASCTCGHIYIAATGNDEANSQDVLADGAWDEDQVAGAVIRKVVEVNGLRQGSGDEISLVSAAMFRLGGDIEQEAEMEGEEVSTDEAMRRGALRLLTTTRDAIVREQEAARKALAGEGQ